VIKKAARHSQVSHTAGASGSVGVSKEAQAQAVRPLWVIAAGGILYFALVFAAGWALGPVRVFWLEPRVGSTIAVLMEQPFMLLAIIFSARWVVQQLAVPRTPVVRLGMGVVATSLMLAAEVIGARWMRGLSLSAYMAGLAHPSGLVFLAMVGVFGLMPAFIGDSRGGVRGGAS
jgi:hypothetical protein